MIIPTNYNEFFKERELSPGGHIIEILSVEEYYKNGNISLKIKFDIKEGSKYDGYFQKLFDSNDFEIKRWPNNGFKYLSLSVNALMYFHQFVNLLEKSNNIKLNVVPGKELDLDQFVGLKIAAQFGLTEYEYKGKLQKQIILLKFQEINRVDEIKIPEVRLLDGSLMDYQTYISFENGIYTTETSVSKENKESENSDITDNMIVEENKENENSDITDNLIDEKFEDNEEINENSDYFGDFEYQDSELPF